MLEFTAVGRGPTVVLLHGFPLDRTIWEPQLRHLQSRYRVVAPDLPGLGKTPPFPEGEPVTMARMAQAVLALLDHLEVERAAVAGHSMGGYVSFALLELAPERVAGLGLVCTQAGADTAEARAARFATAEKVAAEGGRALADSMAARLFAPGTDPSDPRFRSVRESILRAPVAGIRAALHAMAAREDMRSRLPEIRVPTLVLTGADDQLIPPERSEAMAAEIPLAVLVKVPTAGHLPMLEQPDEVNRALDAWLEAVDPRWHAVDPEPGPRR